MDTTTLPAIAEPTLPAAPIDLASRLERHAEITRGAFASNTERARAADSRVFTDWCIAEGRSSLPATPETVAAFVEAMARNRKPATIRRYVSTVAHTHAAVGIPDPTKTVEVRATLRRIAKRLGVRQAQAKGIGEAEVDRVLAATGDSLADLRDVALLLVGRDLLARRSELVALEVEDVTSGPHGTGRALIRKSKTDQLGEGAHAHVSAPAMRALKRWLQAASISSGPIFRRIDKWSKVGRRRMHPASIAKAIKRLAAKAELEDVERISGHSLRVGMAQDLVAAGADLAGVMQAGRWKTNAMPARYAEHLLADRSAVALYHRRRQRARSA
jgi:site-specific recombinase XerD